MPIEQRILERFRELLEKPNHFRVKTRGQGYIIYEPSDWRSWATSVAHLIRAVFGEHSNHYEHFKALYDKCSEAYESNISEMSGILDSAYTDYTKGFGVPLTSIVSGEVYGDFVKLAKYALHEGNKDVAAVLASAALEDSLKRYAYANGLDVTSRSMSEVVSALKSK